MEGKIPYLDMYIDDHSGVCVENWIDTWSVDMHRHHYCEMLLIDKGSCNHIYNGVSTLLVPGDVVVIGPGQEHGYGVLGSLSIYNCQFETEKLDTHVINGIMLSGLLDLSSKEEDTEFAQQLTVLRENMHASGLPSVRVNNSKQGVVHLDPSEQTFFTSILLRAKTEEDAELKHKYAETLLLILKQKLTKQNNTVKCYSRDNQRVIAEVLATIEADLTIAFDINEVAEKYSFSPNYFRKIFKDFTGLSPVQYINKLRVMRACEYISQEGMSIKDAAEKVGVYDLNYFSRMFRKVIGTSPSKL